MTSMLTLRTPRTDELPMRAAARPAATRGFILPLLAAFLTVPIASFAQTGLATVHGRVTDHTGALIIGAEVEIRNVDTNETVTQTSDHEALYAIPSLRPGRYGLVAKKGGFKTLTLKPFDLNVGDNLLRNLTLEVGDVAESITVNADSERLNTTDGSVSTVIERPMVENLPLNGRSFQSLLELTPGINPAVPGQANGRVNQQGQFTVNGQRADANYFIVDGVSANTGSSLGASLGQSGAGVLPNTTAFGGFNGLVSIDALQEFRVTTSSFAPEYGHTPGGQVSLVTRSGGNSYHGAVFDYVRNSALDANDWFLNRAGQKSAARQHDFGGVLGGPIIRNKLFAFLSYEGLRLTNPQAGSGYTFTPSARKQAQYTVNSLSPFLSSYMSQILNAYPSPDVDRTGNITLGTGAVVPAVAPCTSEPLTCVARFTSAFPASAQLDSGAGRIDYALNDRTTLFGRYVYSPSSTFASGSFRSINNTDTAVGSSSFTVGLTRIINSKTTNDLRLNYTNSTLRQIQTAPTFAGTMETLFPQGFAQPAGFSLRDMQFSLQFLGLVPDLNLAYSPTTNSRQRQFNIVDTLSTVKGSHTLKAGVDVRIIDPNLNTLPYSLNAVFYLPAIMNFASLPPSQSGGSGGDGGGPGGGDGSGAGTTRFPSPSLPCGTDEVQLPSFLCGSTVYTAIQRNSVQEFRFPNWSLFVQDTWKIRPRLSLTYGVRHEVAPAPHSRNRKPFFSLKNFDPVKCTSLLGSSLDVLAPAGSTVCGVGVNPLGTPAYPTTWLNIAPRVGIAYQVSQNQNWGTVLRAGFGIFYDAAANGSAAAVGPFSPSTYNGLLRLPAPASNPQSIAPPAIQTAISPTSPYASAAIAAAPDLKLPRTFGFNVAVQQALGSQQSLTLTYVGAIGRKLIGAASATPQTWALNGVERTYFISPTFAGTTTTLTVFGNYATSDYHALQAQFQRQFYHGLGAVASYTWSHSLDDASNFNAGAVFPRSLNRSSSDFDVRQTFTTSLVYDIPTPFKRNKVISSITGHWSVDPIYHFQTALPVNVIAQSTLDTNILTIQRPSIIPGIPLYVYGADCAAQNGGSPCPGGMGFNATPVTNVPDSRGVLPHPECQQSLPGSSGPSVVGYGAFCIGAITGPSSKLPQGNAGRNLLRGFSLRQFDLDIHRDFPIGERLRMRFHVNLFNVWNHPNFSAPQSTLLLPNFGKAASLMNSSFGTGSISSGGGNNPLYSLGGPRSIQLALKIIF
jgi:hypothetical protein